jgi:uncharacterized membrane protein
MLKAAAVSAATMLILDALWLTFRKSYHESLLKSVQGSPVSLRIIPALLVYILVPLAVVYFAVDPSKSLKESLVKGGLFGFSSYALYDLTNLATLKGWTTEMAVIDTTWGTLLCAASAAAAYYVTK